MRIIKAVILLPILFVYCVWMAFGALGTFIYDLMPDPFWDWVFEDREV